MDDVVDMATNIPSTIPAGHVAGQAPIGQANAAPALAQQHLGVRPQSPAGSQSARRWGLTNTKAFVAKQYKSVFKRGAARPEPAADIPLVPLPPANRLTMQLENGQLTTGEDDQLSHAENLLGSVLNGSSPNKGGEQYKSIADAGTPQKPAYLLTDSQDRQVHAQASTLAVTVFKSTEKGPGANPGPHPGNAHLAQITGVHTGPGDQAWRIHDKKLYALHGDTWQEQADSPALKSLHSTGAGDVFGIDNDGKVFSLTDLQTALPFTHKVTALSRSPEGNLVGLTQGKKAFYLERLDAGAQTYGKAVHGFRFLDMGPTPPNARQGDTPASLAIKDDTLFITSAFGKLMHAPLTDNLSQGQGAPDNSLAQAFGDDALNGLLPDKTMAFGGTLKLEEKPSSGTLQRALGEHTYGELFTDENNNVLAKIKDQRGTEHSGSYDHNTNEFKPGWNMSQALVMDRQQGLPALTPKAHEQIPLPRGNIARVGNDLLTEDARTGKWKKSSEKDIKHLQAGQDGFAYLVDKDGTLKQLNVAPKATAHELEGGVDLALPGRGVEAKGAVMRGAELPDGKKIEKVAVQNDQNYMTLSEGILRLHDQNGPRAQLPNPPGTGPIDAMSTGGKDFFVLQGQQIFKLSGAGDSSKIVNSNRQWDPLPANTDFANKTIEDLRPTHDGKLSAVVDGEHFELDGGTWSASAAKAPSTRIAHEHFDQLAARAPDFTRGRFNTAVNVLGKGSLETFKPKAFAPNSIMRNAVTSHLASTGIFTKPVDTIKHAWSGREGLKPVYESETRVMSDLQNLANLARVEPAKTSVATRLSNPALVNSPSPQVKELAELHTWFNQTVIDDTYKTLRSMAEDQGALLANGDLDPAFKASKRPQHDLLQDISNTMRHAGLTNDQPLNALLSKLAFHGFSIPQRVTPSANSTRKKGDDFQLVKARLALNAKIFSDISSSADRLVKTRPTLDGAIGAIAEDLAEVHNTRYNANPIKGFTDAGFRNYTTLESSYDATKSLLKYVRKDNHPVKRNLLDGLQTPPAQLTENLTHALRDLEPRESLKINRNYGGGITGGVTGPAGEAFVGFRGSIDPERTYGMTFTRFDRGLKVSMNKEGAATGTASFGFGGGFSDTHTTPGDSHKNIQSNSSWLGGSLDGKYKYSDNTALSFFIRDDELDAFMADLMDTPVHSSKTSAATAAAATPTITPMALMNRGVEQEVRTGEKHNFDLELNANVESRTNKGQTDAEPVTGFMRFGVGLLANAALLSAEKERVTGRGNDGLRTDIRSSNRVRVLEKGSVAGYARLFSTLFTSRPDNLFIAGGAPIGVTASLSFDRKTGKSYDVRFKTALPLIPSDLKTLEGSLEKAFPDMRKSVTEGKSPEQRLASLKDRYTAKAPGTNDAQYAALTSLDQLDRQNTAYLKKTSLMSTMDMVVKHNDVQRIDKASLLKRLLHKDANPGNAEIINGFMNNDRQLKPLLQALQSTKGTTRAEIKLEVKDDIKKRIEDGALDGTLSDTDLKALLADRDNLRIKSISVFRTAAKDESLGVPLPYVSFKSASNLTIERLEGEVTFEYGQHPDMPKKFTLDGKQADNGNDNVAAKKMGSADNGEYVSS